MKSTWRNLPKTERWLLTLWIVALVWTTTAFVNPRLTSDIVFLLVLMIITLPLAVLLMLLPTIALYLTAGAPVYIWLRKRSQRMAFVVATIVVLVPASIIPVMANRQIAEQVSAIGQPSRWAPVNIKSSQKVAYLYDYGPDTKWDVGCEDHCQRLLFSGVAGRVLLGDTASLNSGQGLKQYWLARSTGTCPDTRLKRLTNVFADDGDVGRETPYPRPLLSELLWLSPDGETCLYEAAASLVDADVVLGQWFRPGAKAETIWGGRFDPRLVVVDQQSGAAIYVMQAGKLQRIRKKTYASASLLRVPLTLDAPNIGFSSGYSLPGRWGQSGRIERGEVPEFGLSKFIDNDLTVRGLK